MNYAKWKKWTVHARFSAACGSALSPRISTWNICAKKCMRKRKVEKHFHLARVWKQSLGTLKGQKILWLKKEHNFMRTIYSATTLNKRLLVRKLNCRLQFFGMGFECKPLWPAYFGERNGWQLKLSWRRSSMRSPKNCRSLPMKTDIWPCRGLEV